VVAVLLRLRFRILANTLSRNPLQLVAVIIGGVSSVVILLVVLGLMVVASVGPPAATQAVVVTGGAAMMLGWFVVPLLFDGVERTLDPIKLARFPLRTGQLMGAMFLVAITWVPGIVTILASAGTIIAWYPYSPTEPAAIATGLIGAATAIAGSRLTTSVAGTLLRGRGAARVGIAALFLLVIAAPIAAILSAGGSFGGGGGSAGGAAAGSAVGDSAGSNLLLNYQTVVDILGWTPFGAIWSVPGRLVMGDSAGAFAATAIGIGTLAAVLFLWRFVLATSLNVRGESQASSVGAGRLGPLGFFPSTPTGAVAARSLLYWFKDSRQARQLILVPLLPALILVWWRLFEIEGVALAAGPIVATLLPLSTFAGLSYDGTAFAAEITAGVRGLHDRLGRAIALLLIAVPSTVLVQVAIAVIVGRVVDLPALLGLSIGTLLVSSGVVSVSSARIVVPVGRAGRNPFSAQAGAATVSIFASYAVTGVTAALALPVIALAVIALVTGSALFGWLAFVVGILLGAGIAFGGIVYGGRLLDSSGPALLARLRLIRA
jgi:ABC-2 type transport system permease protein